MLESKNTSKIKYAVIDHHSMWGWEEGNASVDDAEIIFTWNDFTMEEDIIKWHDNGKKVIVYEHGWNAMFDYEINAQKTIADGYMTLGKNPAESLIRYGVSEKKILITGNPNFDNLTSINFRHSKINVLFVALHWLEDRKEYNTKKLEEIITMLGDYCDISVKVIPYSPIDIPKKVKSVWCSEIHSNKNLFKEFSKGLEKYDIILTPKESTFDFIGLLVGKKVFRVGREEEYREEKDQHSRNILPYSYVTPDLLSNEPSILVNLADEIVESVKINKILEWARSL